MPREFFIDLPNEKRAHDTDVGAWRNLIDAASAAPYEYEIEILTAMALLANELGLADQFLEAGAGKAIGIDFVFEIPVRRHFSKRLEVAAADQLSQSASGSRHASSP